MKFVVQRILSASVEMKGKDRVSIGPGMVLLMGIHREDTTETCLPWIEKILKLRIFPDKEKPINRSIQDIRGEILLISQFTLYGNTQGQNRPSFMEAAPPEQARPIYEHFVERMLEKWPQTKTGQFAEDMKVHLINDGPVTIILE